MSSFCEHLKPDNSNSDWSKSTDPYNDFFKRLRNWKQEYLKQQIEYYARELGRLQQISDNQNQNGGGVPVIEEAAQTPAPQPNYYYEYVLPPVWKRLCAELIDFLILLVIKLYLTFIFIDFVHGVEIPEKNFDFQNYWDNPALAVQVPSEIVILEVISRIVVCLYETYWLKGEPSATPGKKYMGLKVYRATNVFVVQEHPQVIVRAQPCTELGWQYAILRAILKNTFVGLFMFPVCLGFLFINHNRTGYDMITNSLVVEYNPNPPRHEAPM